jgi:hypothetical protein
MRNPVKVHEDNMWYISLPYSISSLVRSNSVWDVNEWFGDMYRSTIAWHDYEKELRKIRDGRQLAVHRGFGHKADSLLLSLDARFLTYSGNEMIAPRLTELGGLDYDIASLGFRVARNK